MYKLIAIAGTFDRLHKGHRYFISEAFKMGEKVIIGLTSDEYVKWKFEIRNSKFEIKSDKETLKTPGRWPKDSFQVEESVKIQIQNFQTRKKELDEFLKQEKLLDRAEIVKIDDVYGPAIERDDIEALVVTSETLKGGELVNRRRIDLGLKKLKLLKIDLISAEDQKRIASTRIRIGEIDRWGKVFESRITNNESRISDSLRQELKKPLGKLIRGDSNNLMKVAEKLKKAVEKTNSTIISTVGDEVTRVCNEIGITINLAIFDYKVAREKKYHSLKELGFASSKKIKTPRGWQAASHDSREVEELMLWVKNPPGHITQELVKAVGQSYSRIINSGKQQIIEVTGEEDLAGLPAILLAPLGSVILYGQPGVGVVLVEVTEAKKQEIMTLISSCNLVTK